MRVCFLALLVAVGATAVPAQPFRPRFNRLALDEGLSQSTVMAALTDRSGYLWLATEDGLNRYDGYGFTVFKNDPANPHALSDSYVLALHEGADGTLWIGTSDGGLNRYDPRTGRFAAFGHDPDDSTSLANGRVTALAQDRHGRLWVATRGGGLDRLDPATGRFAHFRHDPANPASLPGDDLWALHLDRHGKLWIGTRGAGLACLEPGTGRFRRFRHDPADPSSLPHDDVLALHEDAGGALWVGTMGGGVARLDPASGRFTRFGHDAANAASLPSDLVSAVLSDRRGAVWVGTWGEGLAQLDPGTGRATRFRHDPADPYSLGDDYVRSLYESPDESDLIWVGTVSGGVAVLDPAQEVFGLVRHDAADAASLVADYVRAFAETPDGALWVGTRDGLSRLDRGAERFRHFVHESGRGGSLAASYVRALLADRDGTLWVGSAGGLDRYDARTGRFQHVPHVLDDGGDQNARRVYALVDGSDGLLWAAARRGLYAYDRARGRFVRHLTADVPPGADSLHALTDTEVISLAEGSDGALWAGTAAGLNRVDPITGRVTHYRHDSDDPATLPHDRVFSIHPTADAVWVGTNSGLGRLDPDTGRVRRYTEADGLPNGLVYGILEDTRGRLWLSTNRGLARFDPATETFRAYDASDGLQSNEFNQGAFYRAPDGDLLFGGIGGYNRFDPEAIADNTHRPPVVLTDFRVFDRSVTPARTADGAIRLTHDQRFVAFEFAALDFANPARNRYRFRLEGFDDEWQEAGTRRYVSYTNLPGGRYVFRVQGANADGVWNVEGLAIPVVVAPPYWETAWFRLGLVLFVLGLGFGGAWAWQRARLRLVEKSRDEVIEAKRRLAEGREQERLHLARELHDGPVQDLYSANLQLRLASQALQADGTLTPVEATLGRVGGALRAICGDLRPPALSPFGLAAALRSHVEALRSAHPDLHFDLALAPDGQRLPEDVRLALFRIAQEALSNAARHARARAVRVVFTMDAGEAVLEITDDGRGFRPPARPIEGARDGRFGLLGMAERAEAHGGHLTVRSAPGAGTTARAVVPLAEAPPPAEPPSSERPGHP